MWFTLYVIGAVVTTEVVGPSVMREVAWVPHHRVIVAAAGTLTMLLWPIMVVVATVKWLANSIP